MQVEERMANMRVFGKASELNIKEDTLARNSSTMSLEEIVSGYKEDMKNEIKKANEEAESESLHMFDHEDFRSNGFQSEDFDDDRLGK